jgi:hypothetical protein
MSIEQIVKEALNKNPIGLKASLEEELQSRIALALEAKVKAYTEEDDDDEDEDDDDKHLDEISKKTLASYVDKASDDAASHAMRYGEKRAHSDEMDRMMNRHMPYSDKDKVRQIMKTTSKDVDEPRSKAAKRLKGISLAAKKLAK